MLVEDLMDLEVRMTTSTRMFPITPTVSTMLGTYGDGDGNVWQCHDDDDYDNDDDHDDGDDDDDDKSNLNRTKLV